jgi:hypothetical protein
LARAFLTVVGLLLLTAPAQAATPFQLTGVGGKPDVAVDSNGNGHFVWNEGVNPGADVTHYCRILPGASACASSSSFVPTPGDPSSNEDFEGPRVLVSGNFVIVLTERCCGGFPPAQGGDGVIMYVSSDGGASFGPEQVVGDQSTTGNIGGDAILGPDATVSTISDLSSLGTFYQALTPGQFEPDSANLGDSGPSQDYGGTLALIDANTPIAAFSDVGATASTAYFRRYSSSGDYNLVGSWSPTVAIGQGDDTRLAGGPSGVWLLYRTGPPGQTAYVARRFDGSGFGAAVQVSETGDPVFNAFFQDPAGRLHAIWAASQTRDLTYRVSSDGGATYSPPTALASGISRFFNIELAAGPNGQGWAAWDSNSDTSVVEAVPLEVATPAPVLGQTVNVQVVSGTVRVGVRAGGAGARAAQKGVQFTPLTEARQIPVGSFLDTKRGRVRLTSAVNSAGKLQSGEFFAGLFQVLQVRRGRQRGLTEARLKGASFSGCAARGRGKRASTSARRRLSHRTVRRLGGSAKGRFRTRGRNSAATVRGTVWTMSDRCDGTLTRVRRGKVAVRDFRRKRTIVVRAGKRYLAKAAG